MSAQTANGSGCPGPAPIDTGALVVDREDDDPNVAVVVNCPPVEAAEWTVYTTENGEEVTVADDNPAHPADASIAVVVFRADLVDERPDYDGRGHLTLADLEVPFYAFPEGRLRQVGSLTDSVGSSDDPDPDVLEDLEALAERLGDGADVTIDTDAATPRLRVVKLGEEYVIRPAGDVEGDGAVRDRLEAVAEDYLGGDGSA